MADFAGTSGLDARRASTCPLVYTKAYACYALKCAIAPEIPNNAAPAWRRLRSPRRRTPSSTPCIRPRSRCATSLATWSPMHRLRSAGPLAATRWCPPEGAGSLVQLPSLAPTLAADAPAPPARPAVTEVLTFNSGGSGARPRCRWPERHRLSQRCDDHAGRSHRARRAQVIIWRKELRAGQRRRGSSFGAAWANTWRSVRTGRPRIRFHPSHVRSRQPPSQWSTRRIQRRGHHDRT